MLLKQFSLSLPVLRLRSRYRTTCVPCLCRSVFKDHVDRRLVNRGFLPFPNVAPLNVRILGCSFVVGDAWCLHLLKTRCHRTCCKYLLTTASANVTLCQQKVYYLEVGDGKSQREAEGPRFPCRRK